MIWRDVEGSLKPFWTDDKGAEHEAAWAPQPGSQRLAMACPLFEAIIEGNRGGGKTDLLIMLFCQFVDRGYGQDYKGYIFRRTYPELQDVIQKSQRWIPQIWPKARYNSSEHFWRWPTGELLLFRQFDKPNDYWKYHGSNIQFLGWEELTTWASLDGYRRMISLVRSDNPAIQLRVRSTTNPYGPGHNEVKERFRLPIAPGLVCGPVIRDSLDFEGYPEPPRVAIHSHLEENKVLLHSDPDYINRLRSAADSPAQLQAWLHGSWDIVAGGMFDDVWDPHTHILQPFEIPSSWKIDRAFDWGSSKPFSLGWWAESDGSDLKTPSGYRSTVRGDLYRIAEWYGYTGRSNKGLKMLAREISQGIIEREIDMGIHGRVHPGPADSSIWDEENGNSIAYDMMQNVRVGGDMYVGATFTKADKRPGSRVAGWEMMRKFLKNAKGSRREEPGLFIFANCEQWIRTVPVLPRDERKMDDVDTDAEDHCGDETRYKIRGSMRSTGGNSTTGMF